MKQLPDGKPSGSCFAYYLLPTFIEKEWRVIVSLGVFLKRGVDRNFLKPCFSKQLFHFSYQRYLINQIRENFGLEHTPIRLVIRERGSGEVGAKDV